MKKILRVPLYLLLFCLGLPTRAQDLNPAMWGTNGKVSAIARSGNTLYLGGEFSYVGPNTGSGVALSAATGAALPVPPLHIAGRVRAVIPDGSGGWFIGGQFDRVQSVARAGLAHILADGRLDVTWNPVLNRGGYVSTLAVASNVLYVGGTFTTLNGQPRQSLGALRTTTGQLTNWNPGADGQVMALAVAGSTVYAGGVFDVIAGQPKGGLAALDAVTGQPAAWSQPLGGFINSYVDAIVVAGSTVYVGGSFSAVGGQTRNNLAALDAVTGQLTAWNPGTNTVVTTLAASDRTIYAGGYFTAAGGQSRMGLAAFEAVTGRLTIWSPGGTQRVNALTIANNTVYAGGDFDSFGGQPRRNLAALDATTGKVTAWNADAGDQVYALASAGGAIFAGGSFASVGGQTRKNLAALNATTGRLTSWKPDAKGLDYINAINALAAANGMVYVAGRFQSIGGQPRNNLAALDTTTGRITAWNPNPDGSRVNVITAVGNRVYVAGDFGFIGNKPRRGLAQLDAVQGLATDWRADMAPGDRVHAIVADDRPEVYVGGDFAAVGGEPRNNLAALDAATGRVTDWNPNVGPDFAGVMTLALAGNILYAGGSFVLAGEQSRRGLAAFDVTTRRLTNWDPNGGDTRTAGIDLNVVTALAVAGNVVYANDTLYDKPNQLVAFDAAAKRTSWRPGVNGNVSQLVGYEGVVYAAGDFSFSNGSHAGGFAAFGRPGVRRNQAKGNIYEDANGNCVRDPGEKGIAGAVVVARPGDYFASTDSSGNYTLALGAGSYTVSQVISESKAAFIRQVCPADAPSYVVRFTEPDQTIAGRDFANRIDRRPFLSVSVASDRRRRCFTGVTTVKYCNSGAGAAQGVKVFVKLPPYVVPVKASVQYTLDREKNLVFNVGTLAADACGTIQLTDSVVCNDPGIRGLTQCTRAWITPANAPVPGSEWDKSDVTLKARCGNNGRVRLALCNTGAGYMTDSSAYRVYLDAQLAFVGRYKLNAGDSLILQVPANGRTVRLEANQRPGHPSKRSTNVTLEACGRNAAGKVSLGFVAQLPCDDAEPEIAEECLPIIDSFDPNDKAVSPGGVTDQHYTPTRSRLDYVIRFQNTGTDVAYKVVVADTLSTDLDVSTLQVGAVSHPYQVQVSGQGRPVLTFTFNNILLPDSNANEPKSHGYIQFSIRPKADLPEKTRIENLADIFFDYNEPVRTNVTFNTLYDLPPVPAEALRLDGTVVCVPTNPTVAAGTSRTVCVQDTVVLAAIQPARGGGRWERIRGTAAITDPENPNARATGLAYGDNVFQWRVAANTCGSDSLAGRVTITRLRRPATPAITQEGADSLACSAATGSYEWYFEGNPLGLHTRTIKANRPGKYTVRVTEGADCHSEPSPAFAWLPTATEPALAAGVRVYPNPTTGGFVMVLPPDLGQPVQVTLSDAIGRALAVRTLRPGTGGAAVVAFDLSTRQKGVYLLKLQTPKGVVVRKVCKQ